jgi:hypothetical protein
LSKVTAKLYYMLNTFKCVSFVLKLYNYFLHTCYECRLNKYIIGVAISNFSGYLFIYIQIQVNILLDLDLYYTNKFINYKTRIKQFLLANILFWRCFSWFKIPFWLIIVRTIHSAKLISNVIRQRKVRYWDMWQLIYFLFSATVNPIINDLSFVLIIRMWK